MKKILAFTLLPLIFAIIGGFSHEVFQRIPGGDWKMIMGDNYALYNLDSRPIQVLNLDFQYNLYLKTENEKNYSCNYFDLVCQENNDLNKIDSWGIEIRRDIKTFETPKFEGDIVDIVLFKKAMFETLGYNYYLIAFDSSIWHWSWGDNLYEDFFGWTGLGCLGGIIGFVIAFTLQRMKKI